MPALALAVLFTPPEEVTPMGTIDRTRLVLLPDLTRRAGRICTALEVVATKPATTPPGALVLALDEILAVTALAVAGALGETRTSMTVEPSVSRRCVLFNTSSTGVPPILMVAEPVAELSPLAGAGVIMFEGSGTTTKGVPRPGEPEEEAAGMPLGRAFTMSDPDFPPNFDQEETGSAIPRNARASPNAI